MSETTPDARAISRAINEGWIARGFMLGIGFWLAGLFIVTAGAVVVFVAGAALSGLGAPTASTSPASTASTLQPPPVDKRDWREQLRASDAAAQQANRRLESLRAARRERQ